MIRHKDFIYLDLEKTACSHIRKLILKYFDAAEDTNKHKILTSKADLINKDIIGSVRHPYDWYVSHFLYGYHKGGAIRHLYKKSFFQNLLNMSLLDLKKNGLPDFDTFYKADDKKEFKKWLFSILNKKSKYYFKNLNYQKRDKYFHSNSFGYQHLSNQKTGLFTQHFLNMYFLNYAALHPDDFYEVNEYTKTGLIPDHFIKVENLETDFSNIFSKYNPIITTDELSKSEKTNTSVKGYDVEHYLDNECKTLIKQKDNYIFELFGYQD